MSRRCRPSRPSVVAAALLAVLAVLLGPALSAASFPSGPFAKPVIPVASVSAAASVSAPAPAPASVALAPAPAEGPACRPGGSGQEPGAPALPTRPGADHAQLTAARPAPGGERPRGGEPARAPVRGPDRPTPGPVELSILRV
ncbi:hypothetical protein ACIOD1_19405 [Streptomyces sp. NPDC088097]|uniref:hypothetical protein n=1 Tax=Streptomyces sp. NPDC088097 TaxID=3365823 RepID=UPI00382966AC